MQTCAACAANLCGASVSLMWQGVAPEESISME